MTRKRKKQNSRNKLEKEGQPRKRGHRSNTRAQHETTSGLHSVPQNSLSEVRQQESKIPGNPDVLSELCQRCPRCGQPYRRSDPKVDATVPREEIPTNWIEVVKWFCGKLTGRSKKVATWVIAIAILSYGGFKIWPHIEWRIHDIKFCMTVENPFKKEVGLSAEGRFTVYEGRRGENEPLFSNYIFTVSSAEPNAVGTDSITLRRGKTPIQVEFKKTKDLWDVYKNGHTYVDLEFYPAYPEPASGQEPKPAPESGIPFNPGTLRTHEVVRNLVLADDKAPWISLPIKAYFAETQDQTDTLVADAIKHLKQGGFDLRKSFQIPAAPEYFDIHQKQFKEHEEKRRNDPLGLQVDENEDKPWERAIEVRIAVSRDSDDQLIAHLEDVQNRINEKFSMESGSDMNWLSIDHDLETIMRAIVSKYPVRGSIMEVYGDSSEKRYACLNVGSWMGVWEGMEFKVFYPGTNELNGWLEIRVVHPGEEASGVLKEVKDPLLVIEGTRVESNE